MRRIRIATLIDALDIGGAETLTLNLLAERDREQFEDTVFSLREGALAPRVRDVGVPLHSFREGGGLSLACFGWVRRQLADYRPDVVHTHLRTADILGAWACPRLRPPPPMVTTLHTGIGTYSRGTDLRARAMWLAYRRLVLRSPRPVYVAISDAVLGSFRPFLPPGVETLVIENGVPLRGMHPTTPEERLEARASLGLPPEACVIAYVGRMRPEKGHVCLVEAFGRELRDLPDAYLVLAGDGPERAAVERTVAQVGLGDRIRQLGTVDKPDTVLRAADVFVIPSTREGFGLVVIEAFAFGLPVVAAAVDALPGLVADGRNGVLVPPADPTALGRALRGIVTDAHYRARLAEGARAKDLTPWSIERAARAYEDLYRRLALPAHT